MAVKQSPDPAQSAEGPADEPLYGIIRGNGRHGTYWQVSLGRQRRLLARSFFDGIYGGSDAALAMAKAFRDAVMAVIPPRTWLEVSGSLHSANNISGFKGIHPVKRQGEIVGWEAMLENKGKTQRKRFSIREYGAQAQKRAIVQRNTWLEAAEIAFFTRDELATEIAEQKFPEYLTGRPEPMRMPDAEIDAHLEKINAEFDALRPLWVNVSVVLFDDDQRLKLYVSDSGWPARKFMTDRSLCKHSLGAALAILRADAAHWIGEYFDQALRECFLAVHGVAFNLDRFNPKEGLSIHELPGTLLQQAMLTDREVEFSTLVDRWQVETWLDGRPFWEKPGDTLYAIARHLADTALQKPPRKPIRQPLTLQRKTKQHVEAGIGVYRREGAWTLNIRRQDRKIVRCFSDVNFPNGKEEAMRQAMAYRDAAFETFPQPLGAQKRKISKANTTGIPGIFRVMHKGELIGWRATFNSVYFGSKAALFKVIDHGDEGARALAVTQRQKWIDEVPAVATGSDSRLWEPFTDEEFARHLANLDRRFGCGLSAKSRRRVKEPEAENA